MVDKLSLITTPIWLRNDEKINSQGTGFYFSHEFGENNTVGFLVTNYHVLTGHPPTESRKYDGDNIIFQYHISDDDPGNIANITLPLFTEDGKPVWIMSNSVPNADIAVIPLIYPKFKGGVTIQAISENWAEKDVLMEPSNQVILIGYPYGFHDEKNALPIWKTGSIASEPEKNFNGEPLFIIDVSAFPGMSGSPVFGIIRGDFRKKDGTHMAMGYFDVFLGIYAANQVRYEGKYIEKLVQNERPGIIHCESLELGHVWKYRLIHDIIRGVDIHKYNEDIVKNVRI